MLRSLDSKLLALVLAAIAPLFVLILYNAAEERTSSVAAARQDALGLAGVISREHSRVVDDGRQFLAALARVPILLETGRACEQFLQDLQRIHARYIQLGVAAPDGAVVCSAVPATGDVTAADRPWFRAARERLAFVVGDYQVGRVTGKSSVIFAQPIGRGTGAGPHVLFGALDLGWLAELVSGAHLPEAATLLVLDRTGTVLVRVPDPGRSVGQSLADTPIVKTILQTQHGTLEAPGLDGIESIWGFRPIHRGGDVAGFIAVGTPRAGIVARANRLLWRDLAILALVAASALVAARLVARALIIRPVNALLETTKEIAAGSFASRADTRSRGELGRLAGAFNRMANTIQKRQAELDASLETLRQTNEKLRSLVQASPLAIVLYDAAGRIQLWNPAAESMFGWREHELLGQPPDRQGEIDGHRVRSLGGEVLDGVETVGQARDGRHLDVRVFSAVLHDASGRVDGVLVVYEDITARKRAEQEAARQREALFRSEKLADLGRLAAGVAHELRNPLTVVDGRAQMLKRLAVNGPVGPDTLGGHLDSLEEAVNRMRRIVHGLSTYGKPERIDRATVDLGDLLTAVTELIGYNARNGNVKVVRQIANQLPKIVGDRSQLMQVLVNLTTNAIEAMAPAGGLLTLSAYVNEETEAHTVVVEIADSGPGIAPEQLERISEAFYTTKTEGTGLGLSIVRALVAEQPGAQIGLRSTVGVGTVFSLTFPSAALPLQANRVVQ